MATGLLVVLVGAVVARQVTGRGPGVWLLFGVGAVLTVGLGLTTLAQTASALESAAPVILFLLSLFLFAGALREAGALDHLARWIVGRARRPEDLPMVLFLGFGAAAAFLVNDALVLIGAPLFLGIAARLRADPKPLLLVLAFSVTVGSVLTPFGNPQNLLVSVESGMRDPVVTFLRYLLLPTAINLAFGAWYLRRTLGPSLRDAHDEFEVVRRAAPPLIPRGGWGARWRAHPALWLFPATILVILGTGLATSFVDLPAVPVWVPAAAGAALLVALSHRRTRLFASIDWKILVLFAGLFVVVAGAVADGVVTAAESVVHLPGPGHPTNILVDVLGTSVVGSQLVSNVPWVALQVPLLSGLGYSGSTPIPWLALAAGSTLAGNVTLLGAASNLIVAELAEAERVPFRLASFARYGLPLAAVTLAVLAVCLAFGL